MVGDVTVRAKSACVPLTNVCSLPTFSKNLLRATHMIFCHKMYGKLTFACDKDCDGLYHVNRTLPTKVVDAYANEEAKHKTKKPACVMDVKAAHWILGHADELHTRKTAAKLNWKLTRTWSLCLLCMEAKAQSKPLPSQALTQATKPGKRLCVNLTGCFLEAALDKFRYAMVIKDQFTERQWVYGLKKKSCMHSHLDTFLRHNAKQGFPCTLI